MSRPGERMSEAPQSPEGRVSTHSAEGCVRVVVDRTLYPLDSIYGAAYAFVDRCYVRLDAPDERSVQMELRGRESLGETALQALAGEFGNELLAHAWRHRIMEKNRSSIEAVTLQALAGATGGASPSDMDDDDAFDDPLGIAVPWEERHGPTQDPGAQAPDGGDDGKP